MREYGITLLKVYPKLRRAAESLGKHVEKLALASFSGSKTSLDAAEEIAETIGEKEFCLDLAAALDALIARLSDGDRLLLEYKYFRSRDAARYEGLDPTSRTYFRRQNRAYERFFALLVGAGYTQKWFNAHAMLSDWLREAHTRVLAEEARKRSTAEKLRAASPRRAKTDADKANGLSLSDGADGRHGIG